MTPPLGNMTPYEAVMRALDNAPVGDSLTPEDRAELDQAMADMAAGKLVMVPHE